MQICFKDEGKPVWDYEQAALQHCQHTCVRVRYQGILQQLPRLFSSKALMPGKYLKVLITLYKILYMVLKSSQ